MLGTQRRQKFTDEVARQRLGTGPSHHDGRLRAAGAVLMVAGVVGAFAAYNVSLAQDDLRDVGSQQTLATGFLALTVLGAALYLAAAVTRVLRLWLLRQLLEAEDRAERLAEALERR